MIARKILELWADYDPVEAYASGMDARPRKLYRPSPDNAKALLTRVAAAQNALPGIADADLRASTAKILEAISVDVRFPKPDTQVGACAAVLLCILLKQDEGRDFVSEFLSDVGELVRFENRRLAGHSLPAEIAKLCLNSADFLEAMLAILKRQRPNLSASVASVLAELGGYRELFNFAGLDAHEFDKLFPVLEANNTGPRETPGYEEMLSDLYDYGMTAREIRARSLALLDRELHIVNELSRRLAPQLGLPADSDLGEVYAAMERHFSVEEQQLALAERIVRVVNAYTEFFVQDLDNRSFINPEPAPAHLTDVVTSGATVVLNYLTPEPLVKVFYTEGRNRSRLTMLNVLVHEGTHAHRGLLSAATEMPPLLKRRTYLSIPLNEGMAFHRELEFFLAAKESLEVSGTRYFESLPEVVREFLELFGETHAEREFGVSAFEMETRIWRVARFVRAVCDVEVNTGISSYVEFVNWAHVRTGLSREFVHNECFPFLSNPGYTPAYAICGTTYGEIQAERRKRGVPDRSFNTQAGRMGFFPWSICKARLMGFGAEPTGKPWVPTEQPGVASAEGSWE